MASGLSIQISSFSYLFPLLPSFCFRFPSLPLPYTHPEPSTTPIPTTIPIHDPTFTPAAELSLSPDSGISSVVPLLPTTLTPPDSLVTPALAVDVDEDDDETEGTSPCSEKGEGLGTSTPVGVRSCPIVSLGAVVVGL